MMAKLRLPDEEPKDKPKRRPIPDHIPWMEVELTAGDDDCAKCGGLKLRLRIRVDVCSDRLRDVGRPRFRRAPAADADTSAVHLRENGFRRFSTSAAALAAIVLRQFLIG